MINLLASRDYLKIQEAAEALGVSEQTLRNWDKAGKLRAHRHPINGYRLYRASDLHALLEQITPEDRVGSQLALGLPTTPHPSAGDHAASALPPSHWSAAVALDPKHRPQRWDAVASTVRRDWRKAPQEAYVMDARGKAYRRLT